MKGSLHPLSTCEAAEQERRDKSDMNEQKNSKVLSSEFMLNNSLHCFLKKTKTNPKQITNQTKTLLCVERTAPQPGHKIFPGWEEVQIIARIKRCRLLLNDLILFVRSLFRITISIGLGLIN